MNVVSAVTIKRPCFFLSINQEAVPFNHILQLNKGNEELYSITGILKGCQRMGKFKTLCNFYIIPNHIRNVPN